jgi:polyphosphate kinase 2 (PPK2 family)
MELEKQACSSELAGRLKELGVKQASLFVWLQGSDYGGPGGKQKRLHTGCDRHQPVEPNKARIAAFTAAEVGEIKHWFVYFSTDRAETPRTNKSRYMQAADTEADARAKMLVYLLEQKLIPPNGGEIGRKDLYR